MPLKLKGMAGHKYGTPKDFVVSIMRKIPATPAKNPGNLKNITITSNIALNNLIVMANSILGVANAPTAATAV
jgi:hypothetical protein